MFRGTQRLFSHYKNMTQISGWIRQVNNGPNDIKKK